MTIVTLATIGACSLLGLFLGTTPRCEPSLGARIAVRVRRRVCRLRGHNELLNYCPSGRISLLCSNCGEESPGWDV